jgi:hypothetical protein
MIFFSNNNNKEIDMTDAETELVFERARKALIEGLKSLEDLKSCNCERCKPINDREEKQ